MTSQPILDAMQAIADLGPLDMANYRDRERVVRAVVASVRTDIASFALGFVLGTTACMLILSAPFPSPLERDCRGLACMWEPRPLPAEPPR